MIVYSVYYSLLCTLYSRVYQNLATSSENYSTFPKVGKVLYKERYYYKENAFKLLARSDYSLRPNSCVLFEIFVARRKKVPRSNMGT